MTIRRKLRISLTLAALVALALLVSLAWTQSRIEQLGRAAVLANEVVLTVFELDRLTYEYVFGRAERAREQWGIEHQSLERRLEEMIGSGAESPAVERISAAQLKLEDLFSRIASEPAAGAELRLPGPAGPAPAPGPDTAPDDRLDGELARERQEILFHQLVLFSRVMINEAAALHRESLARQAALRRWQTGVLLGALLVLGTLLIGSFGLILQSVGGPVEQLRRGAERVSEGDLEHRVEIAGRDEIGELAHAFNHMTARLADSYAALRAEVAVRTRAEGALRAASQELEDRVESRTAELSGEIERRRALEHELQQRNRDLAAANHAKDEFLAMVSHELRTPLTAMLGWVRLLRTGSPDAAKLQRGLDVIERNARAQASLIDDLLDVSRIVSGKMALDLHARRPAAGGRGRARRRAAGRGGQAGRPALCGGAGRQGGARRPRPPAAGGLQPALQRHQVHARGRRSVELRLERAGRHVVITVSDTGIGIGARAPALRLRALPPGRRRRDHASTGGLGLGLAIVAPPGRAARRRRSPPTARARGRARRFTVRLPVTALHPPTAGRESARRSAGRTRRLAGALVLVVEDDPDARELLLVALAPAGRPQPPPPARSAEALMQLREQRPDLLLSDIGLPGEDGYSLIRRVRAWPAAEGGDVPAVALTAFAKQEDRRRALEAGFQEHVTKPVDPELLVSVLAGLLAGRIAGAARTPAPRPGRKRQGRKRPDFREGLTARRDEAAP